MENTATNSFPDQWISVLDDQMNRTFPKWPRPRTATHLKSWRLNWNCSSSLENDQCLRWLDPLWTECPAWSWKYRTILKKTTWQLTSKAGGFKARGQCLHPSYHISPLNICTSHYNMIRPRRCQQPQQQKQNSGMLPEKLGNFFFSFTLLLKKQN